MKIIRFLLRFAIALSLTIGLACLGLWASGNVHLIKAIQSTYLVGKTGPSITDYTKFENRRVEASKAQAWKHSSNYNLNPPTPAQKKEIDKWETVAFLVIQDREIHYEDYAEGYSEKSLTNSFSMAKSLTSLAIGAAIKEGKIKSLDQKVGDFLPEFKEGKKTLITIKDLLTMSSGIDFGESYGDPFGYMAKTYYGKDLYDLTVNKSMKYLPGEVWKYQGGNTLLLAFILKKATGQNLSEYFSQHFWKPLGASEDALWSITEKGGMERAYCCFYSNARDFARIGQLILDSGKWNGKQLIDNAYFNHSFKPVNLKDEQGETINYYGFQWWLGEFEGDTFHYARGIQGQYIVAIPAWKVVFVRLGHQRDPTIGIKVPSDLIDYLGIVKSMTR